MCVQEPLYRRLLACGTRHRSVRQGSFSCAAMAVETVASNRQKALQDASALCDAVSRSRKRRQILRPDGLTSQWLETVGAAYLISDCNIGLALFVARKLSGLRADDPDYPSQDLVEEIALSVSSEMVFSRRAYKEAAEGLLLTEISNLDVRGVAPSAFSVYAMFQALRPGVRSTGSRAKNAWAQRFRKRWKLFRRAWVCKPDLNTEPAKNKAGRAKK